MENKNVYCWSDIFNKLMDSQECIADEYKIKELREVLANPELAKSINFYGLELTEVGNEKVFRLNMFVKWKNGEVKCQDMSKEN